MKRTLIALALMLTGAAHADAVQDSLESCRQLQAGPIPVTCSVKLDNETITFLFGFVDGTNTDEASIAIASVFGPICGVMPVRLVFFATDGQRLTSVSTATCADGELSPFTKVDPSTLKPAVY